MGEMNGLSGRGPGKTAQFRQVLGNRPGFEKQKLLICYPLSRFERARNFRLRTTVVSANEAATGPGATLMVLVYDFSITKAAEWKNGNCFIVEGFRGNLRKQPYLASWPFTSRVGTDSQGNTPLSVSQRGLLSVEFRG